MTIRELRQQAGLTQKEFSVLFGIPKRTIEDWERGVRTPAPYLVALIEFKFHAMGGNLINEEKNVREMTRTILRYIYLNELVATKCEGQNREYYNGKIATYKQIRDFIEIEFKKKYEGGN